MRKDHIPFVLVLDSIRFDIGLVTEPLAQSRFKVRGVNDLKEMAKASCSRSIDVLVLDIQLLKADQLDWFERWKNVQPEMALVLLLEMGDILYALEKVSERADGYIFPHTRGKAVIQVMERALHARDQKTHSLYYPDLKPVLGCFQSLFQVERLDEFARVTLNALKDYFECDHGGIYLAGDQEGSFSAMLHSQGVVPSVSFLRTIQKPVRYRSYPGRNDQDPAAEFLVAHGLTSWMGVPLLCDERWLGIVVLCADTQSVFSRMDLQVLEEWANFLAEAVESFYQRFQPSGDRFDRAWLEDDDPPLEEASVKQLMTSIAHEINNPLQALQTNLELAKRMQEPEKIHEYLSVFQHEFFRLRSVVKEMFAVYRPDLKSPERFSVNNLLREVLRMYEPRFMRTYIYPEIDLAEELPEIWGVPIRLERVLMDVLDTVVESMPQGGKIFCSTKLQNNKILVMIKDKGNGIPKEEIELVFQPFYSIKDQTRGSGLTICDNIINMEKQGSIEVNHSTDRGACFVITLPLGG
jgi:signal transduction histidine kinase/FixJ family two-component response regulator